MGLQESKNSGFQGCDEGYSLSLQPTVWSYASTSEPDFSRLMDIVLKRWMRAHRLGFRVKNVLYRGEQLNERQVELCNLWIESGDVIETAKLHHWQAIKRFERVILWEKPKA